MRDASDLRPPVEASRVRHRTYAVIFGHDTRPGRIFDVLLIVAILASVLVIMLESVASVRAEYGGLLRGAEWFFTLLFTIEYGTRLWCVGSPLTYAKSPLGLIDLLAQDGIQVARRTVAKYREAMGIPSSSERKRLA